MLTPTSAKRKVTELDEERHEGEEVWGRSLERKRGRCEKNVLTGLPLPPAAMGRSSPQPNQRQFDPPLLPANQLRNVSVPFHQINNGELERVMGIYGFAVVTGVVNSNDVAELKKKFEEDLSALLIKHRDDYSVQSKDACAGHTGANRKCKITSRIGGHAKKHAVTLRQGYPRCAMHLDQDTFSIPLPTLAALASPGIDKVYPLETWTSQHAEYFAKGGRCAQRGLPHGKFAWSCRMHPGVRACYEVLYKTNDLVVSLDNPFFTTFDDKPKKSNKSWPHTDCNTRACSVDDGYQGILYVLSAESKDVSSTVVWPGSHKNVHDIIMNDPKCSAKNNYVALSSLSTTTRGMLESQWRANAVRVPVSAGSLLIFNSKTVHQGWQGGRRLAQAISFEPTNRRSLEALERKCRMSCLGMPSTHWASRGEVHPDWKCECLLAPIYVALGGEDYRLKPSLSPAQLATDFINMWQDVGDRVQYCHQDFLRAEVKNFL